MKVFVAHSHSLGEAELAADVATWLRSAGFEARSGSELLHLSSKPWMAGPLTAIFAEQSIWARGPGDREGELPVDGFLRDADLLVAICLHPSWGTGNVLFEIGYFFRRDRSRSVILVKNDEVEAPGFLKQQQVLTVRKRADFLRELKQAVRRVHEDYKRQRGQFFLSYAKEDSSMVGSLYRILDGAGYNIWFDRARLVVGEDWNERITREIRDSVGFIACFSKNSVDKKGYYQVELRRSLEAASYFPQGASFVLPVRLDDCEVPERFRKYHWCDWRDKGDEKQLRKALDGLLEADWERRQGAG